LREFVYLDEVSVYSLIASRLGPIATEFTDTETNSLRGEIASSFGANAGIAKGDVTARTEAASTQASQVLRKSIVQTTFKELFELESDGLPLRPMDDRSAPRLESLEALETGAVGSSAYEGWILDPETLRRGQVIEAEVELEADSVFRVNAVMTAVLEMMQENLELFGVEDLTELSQARSINRVLEKLLTGLVPLRGRSVDYEVVGLGQQEWLVHRALLDQLAPAARAGARPLFVVGVADRSLFWKDIRRVLFSNSRFRLFCRIAQTGLRDDWTPVKLVDVLGEIAPELGTQVGALGEGALVAMGDAVSRTALAEEQKGQQARAALLAFASLLTEHHETPVDQLALNEIVSSVSVSADAMDSVGGRRVLFGEVVRRVDEALSVQTSPEIAAQYRVAALADAGLGLGGSLTPVGSQGVFDDQPAMRERFLDTEIVAIYW
jgi:hypothetical protein